MKVVCTWSIFFSTLPVSKGLVVDKFGHCTTLDRDKNGVGAICMSVYLKVDYKEFAWFCGRTYEKCTHLELFFSTESTPDGLVVCKIWSMYNLQ